MRVPRVYLPELPRSGPVELTGPPHHYLVNVLRLEPGRPLIVFDGKGREGEAVLTSAGKRAGVIEVQSCREISRESPLPTHLAVGVSRGERFDWVLQKATELGVTAITPLWTERTEVKLKGDRLEKKFEHWQQILVSACEQCQRNQLPQLQSTQPLAEFVNKQDSSLRLILHPGGAKTLGELLRPEALTLLIGPEGGLSDTETELALNNGYNPISLGPRILRTETAPLAVLACAQLLWGDFG